MGVRVPPPKTLPPSFRRSSPLVRAFPPQVIHKYFRPNRSLNRLGFNALQNTIRRRHRTGKMFCAFCVFLWTTYHQWPPRAHRRYRGRTTCPCCRTKHDCKRLLPLSSPSMGTMVRPLQNFSYTLPFIELCPR